MKTKLLLAFTAISAPIVFGDCIIEPDAAVDFAARDTNRLNGDIVRLIAQRDPYAGLLPTGTTPNYSESTRNLVQHRAWMGHSMAAPEFTATASVCGTNGELATVGTIEYTETLGTLRGRGPKVCVKTTRTAFKASYELATDSLRNGVADTIIADKQYTLASRSGVKLTLVAGNTFEQMLTGGQVAIDTDFATDTLGLPTSPLNFKVLTKAASVMREELDVEPFDLGPGGSLHFIGSYDAVDYLRDQLTVREDMHALTTGRYSLGEKTITGYTWYGPYRGIAMGVTKLPLRFSALDTDSGQPIYIEPWISVAGTNGTIAVRNPAYNTALYEVGLLIGRNSFMRNTPAPYNGAGGFKWPGQLANAKLEFVSQRDNDCNQFQDFGQHLYEIERSYRPRVPAAVMAIAYKRCIPNLGLIECADPYTPSEEV